VTGACRRIAWTNAVIHGVVHASVLLLPLPALLSDVRRSFGVSLLSVLGVANLMYLAFGLAAIPAGFLADRVGSRRMLVTAAGGCGTALLLVALAPSFWVFSAGLVLLGLSAGVYHPSGLSLLSRGVASGERGRAIGIHGVGGTLGEALAPAWAAFFAASFGWRTGFAATGLLALASVALATTLPAEAHEHGPARAPGGARGEGWTCRSFAGALLGFWRSRPLRWLLLSMIAGGLVYRGVLTFLPLHLWDSSGASASYLISGVLLAGHPIGELAAEALGEEARERLFLAEVALYVPVLLLLGLTSGVGLVALALCFGFLWYLSQPLANALTAAHAETKDHGLLYGIQFAATFGVGSFATTFGGLLHARGGSSLALLGFGAVALLQLGAAFALVATVRGRAPEAAAAERA
jgi:predicted MFS family arabinose efflux permease